MSLGRKWTECDDTSVPPERVSPTQPFVNSPERGGGNSLQRDSGYSTASSGGGDSLQRDSGYSTIPESDAGNLNGLLSALGVQLQLIGQVCEVCDGADPSQVSAALTLFRKCSAVLHHSTMSMEVSKVASSRVSDGVKPHSASDPSPSKVLGDVKPGTTQGAQVRFVSAAPDGVQPSSTSDPVSAGVLDGEETDPTSSKKTRKTKRPQSVSLVPTEEKLRQTDQLSRATSRLDNLLITRMDLTDEIGDMTLLQRIVFSHGFDLAIGVVIAINAATIGIETSLHSEGKVVPVWIETLDYVFLGIYICELSLRFVAFGIRCLESHWVRFDAFLVVAGIVCLIIDLAFKDMDGSSGEVMEKVMLVRVFRLARLAQLVRLVVQFKVLWLLVQGLSNSIMTLVWTFVIISVLLYAFAILGLELMRPDPERSDAYNETVRMYFSDLKGAYLTLFQGIFVDSMGSIYRPIILEQGEMFFYFTTFLMVVSIALINLLTAIMVESSIARASQDKECVKAWERAEKKKLISELEEMFGELDADGSGFLELKEIRNADNKIKAHLADIANTTDSEEIVLLFRTMDYDNSGSIGIKEFCEGLMKVQDGKPLEITCITRQCNDILNNLRSLQTVMTRSSAAATATAKDTPGVNDCII